MPIIETVTATPLRPLPALRAESEIRARIRDHEREIAYRAHEIRLLRMELSALEEAAVSGREATTGQY